MGPGWMLKIKRERVRAGYSVTGVRGGERSTHMLAVSVDACLDVLAVVAVREGGARSFCCNESDPNILRGMMCGAAWCAEQHGVRSSMMCGPTCCDERHDVH